MHFTRTFIRIDGDLLPRDAHDAQSHASGTQDKDAPDAQGSRRNRGTRHPQAPTRDCQAMADIHKPSRRHRGTRR